MTRADIARELEGVWRETRVEPPRLQVRLALLKMIERVTSRDAAEIARLTQALQKVTAHKDLLESQIDRWLPCPDCRDKTERGVCLRCETQRLESRLKRQSEGLARLIAKWRWWGAGKATANTQSERIRRDGYGNGVRDVVDELTALVPPEVKS